MGHPVVVDTSSCSTSSLPIYNKNYSSQTEEECDVEVKRPVPHPVPPPPLTPWQLFNSKQSRSQSSECGESKSIQGNYFLKPTISPPCVQTLENEPKEAPSAQVILNRFMACVQMQKFGNYTQAEQEMAQINALMREQQEKLSEISLKKNEEEKSVQSWGLALDVMAWIGTMFMLITGATLIATGVGTVAGALLITGGLLSLGSKFMDVCGGWKALSPYLGKTAQERATVLSWMQIIILVLSVVCAGAGTVFSGYKVLGEAAPIASAMLGATARMAEGVCHLGKARADGQYYESLAELRRQRAKQDELHAESKDLAAEMKGALEQAENGYRLLRWYTQSQKQVNDTIQSGIRGPQRARK